MMTDFDIGLCSKTLFPYRMRSFLKQFLFLFSIGFIFTGCSSLKTKNEKFSQDNLGDIVLIPEERQLENCDTVRWGDVFKSEELSRYVKEGLASNHDYRILALQVQQAHQVSMIAGADQLPRFGIGARGNRAKQNFSGSGGLAGVGIGILNNARGATLNTTTGAITGTVVATSTIGKLSTAVGVENLTEGNFSTAVGYQNKALGLSASTFGLGNTASA